MIRHLTIVATLVPFQIYNFLVICYRLTFCGITFIVVKESSWNFTFFSFNTIWAYNILHNFSLFELIHKTCEVSLEELDKMQLTLYLDFTWENFPQKYFHTHFNAKWFHSLHIRPYIGHIPFLFCVFCCRNYCLSNCICVFSVCASNSSLYLFFFFIVSHDFQLCACGITTAVYDYAMLQGQFWLLQYS